MGRRRNTSCGKYTPGSYRVCIEQKTTFCHSPNTTAALLSNNFDSGFWSFYSSHPNDITVFQHKLDPLRFFTLNLFCLCFTGKIRANTWLRVPHGQEQLTLNGHKVCVLGVYWVTKHPAPGYTISELVRPTCDAKMFYTSRWRRNKDHFMKVILKNTVSKVIFFHEKFKRVYKLPSTIAKKLPSHMCICHVIHGVCVSLCVCVPYGCLCLHNSCQILKGWTQRGESTSARNERMKNASN